MKAARLYDRHDVRVERIPEPMDIGHGQLLVGPTFCGISWSDLHAYEVGPAACFGEASGGSQIPPRILGREFAAKVVAIGEGVESVKPGDRISVQPPIGPYYHDPGRRMRPILGAKPGILGFGAPLGGMAERAIVNEYNAMKIPSEITDQQGALIEPAALAVYAIDRSGLRPGSTVLVTGAGPVGALTALAARAAGAARIFVSEPNASRRRRLFRIVGDIVLLDPGDPMFLDIIRANTEEGAGVDAAIECVGSAAALRDCLRAVRAQGTVVQVGFMPEKTEIDPLDLVVRDITLRGALHYPPSIWPRVFAMISSGLLPVDRIVDEEVALEEVVERGFRPLLDPGKGKVKILVATRTT